MTLPVLELVNAFSAAILAMIAAIAWNFATTKRVRNKVFGDGKDPTESGLAVTVENHAERLRSLEDENENEEESE